MMKYCTAKKISTQQVYNNEYEVMSIHKSMEEALKTKVDYVFGVFEIDDSINRGDSINDSGKRWESA